MNLEQYQYSTNNTFLDYEFESVGPNGRIKKLVKFSPQNINGTTYFNLAFGDLDNDTGQIDDLCVSNNHDRNKILATIAATVIEFTDHFPDMMVYAQGSTPARTRLYQMGITANWEQIEPVLDVYGFVNDDWEIVRKNVNYFAFSVIRKNALNSHYKIL